MAKRYFTCPLCERRDAASIRERDVVGDWGERFWIGCLRCEVNMTGRDYLHQLAEAIGCRSIELLQRADELLAEYLDSDSGRESHQVPLPPPSVFSEYEERLQASNGPLKYLRGERGISAKVLRRYQVGLNDGGRLAFPMRDGGGHLVAYKTRPPTRHGQMRSISGSGRDWPLYPWPTGSRPLLICAGELDALCAISYGLHACSVTLGAGTWRHAWTAAVYERSVVICFDNGEHVQARALGDQLLASGVDARVVSLRKLGLKTAKGDISDYLIGGGEPAALLKGAR
jgi:hypothetical protein